MPALITTLIDKTDNFEVVRDEIAAILVLEQAGQQALALAATPPQKASAYELRIFSERANPWEEFVVAEDEPGDFAPIVNVWFDKYATIAAGSNAVERQRVSATYNIDCYGYGISASTEGGHDAGDEMAALEAHRAARLARNILMAGAYTYLGTALRGIVGSRMVQAVTSFQPQLEGRPVSHVQAARIELLVVFNEFSPQVQGQVIELISVEVKRLSTGAVIADADYDTSDWQP